MPWDSHFPHFSTIISILQHLPISISLSIMPCSSHTRKSAHITVWITCLPTLKSPNFSTASTVRYLLHKYHRTGDKQHSYLTSLPIFTLLVSLWSSLCLALWSPYNLLNSLLLIPLPFRICINLVQFTQPNAISQFTKQAHSFSSMSKVHSDIILSIPMQL